ncbi:hypothetical protein AB1N83_001601 [Pleurotus pulmonarius]
MLTFDFDWSLEAGEIGDSSSPDRAPLFEISLPCPSLAFCLRFPRDTYGAVEYGNSPGAMHPFTFQALQLGSLSIIAGRELRSPQRHENDWCAVKWRACHDYRGPELA